MSDHRSCQRQFTKGRGQWALLPPLLFALLLVGCSVVDAPPKVAITSDGGAGPESAPVIGESMTLALDRLRPNQRADIYLNDDDGKEWSYARVFADEKGRVAPFVFWYHTGVIGRPPSGVKIGAHPDPAFVTFEEAEEYFANHALTLAVRDGKGELIAELPVKLGQRTKPTIYPSGDDGILMNSFNVYEDAPHVSAKNLPAGAKVSIAVVENQRFWHEGAQIRDLTGKDGAAQVDTFQLAPGETRFTRPVWNLADARPGAYDIILRVNDDFRDPRLRPDDIVSYGDDTAFLMFVIINGNTVIDIAGRTKSFPAKFEFNDSFEKGETVWGAVDPTDVPAVHPGGSYAAYTVVDDQPDSYWDGVAPNLMDVSADGARIHRVKYWCLNGTRDIIWPNATQSEPIKAYDVVVDFGSVPAMNSSQFVPDNTYNKGTDFIDGYQDAGFYLFEDPSSPGPFTNVATVDYLNETGITGMPYDPGTPGDPTDPGGITGPDYIIDLAWARIMYPAQSAGANPPVSTAQATYPVALFEHGRHANCDSNGSAAGGVGSYEPPGSCAPANRIPSHRGYDYIMSRLASQGIIAISIDTAEIQDDNGAWNYDVRGRLILKWLDILRTWHLSGTDPWGGIFQGKLDLTKIALSGHSRGGEGVIAAEHLNDTWPTPHSIVAINAIAPTDQNYLGGISYIPDEAAYYLTIGARDGDVSNMQGLRTYDRAYPQGAPNRDDKMLATIYGANHNYFNTIWTDAAALGGPNPWASARDDALNPFDGTTVQAPGAYVMPAADQRQAALTTIAAFFRRYLQRDLDPSLDAYKEIFTGRVKPAAVQNDQIYWAYQDKERTAVDNFEQRPVDVAHNSLCDSTTLVCGTTSNTGFSSVAEALLTNWLSSSNYTAPPPLPPQDSAFYHATLGLKLSWVAAGTYETNLPGGLDVSGYTHLSFRAAKKVTGAVAPGPDVNLFVDVEDGSGTRAAWVFRTDQFDPIPHPYLRNPTKRPNQALLTGVRIPLRKFQQHSSGVDLTDLVKIIITTQGSGEIGIDDIEFGK
jgi:hypothetical protein